MVEEFLRMRSAILNAILAAIAWLAVPVVGAAPVPCAAILPIHVAPSDTAGAQALEKSLSDKFSRISSVRFFDRAWCKKKFAAMGLGRDSKCSSMECVANVGAKLGVDRCLAGTIERGETGGVQVNLWVVDVKSRKRLAKSQIPDFDVGSPVPDSLLDRVLFELNDGLAAEVPESSGGRAVDASNWLLWVASGAAVVAAGVGAAYLFLDMSKDRGSSTSPDDPNTPPPTDPTGSVTLSWY